MQTECTPALFDFEPVERKKVVAGFDGGTITSDAGALLLGRLDRGLGLIPRMATCFMDRRIRGCSSTRSRPWSASACSAWLWAMTTSTIMTNCVTIRCSRFWPASSRPCARAVRRWPARARSTGWSTRRSATPRSITRSIAMRRAWKRCSWTSSSMRIRGRPRRSCSTSTPPTIRSTASRKAGSSHGYYDCYCYLPLYIFCGRFLLCAKLRPSNIDGAAGAVDEVARIVARIRARWPKVRIVLRGDSGFCREELMTWCEESGVGFVFGLAPNERLKAVLAPEAWEAERRCETTGKAARVFKDFAYRTEKTWSRARRVVGKAEHLPGGANLRFVVTSLPRTRIDARALYEDLYCARGEMENRIKEQQLNLFADRTSSATMTANQLRLWFSSMAYVLLNELRRIALRHTRFADATCGTIRLKLLKIGALVRRSVRRIKFAMASGFPSHNEFALAYVYLERAFPR